jgi:tripartite motif-containing protein 2/3
LDEAERNIAEEIGRLENAENAACQVVEKAFEEAVRLLDRRRKSYVAKIKETATVKLEKLHEQIQLIEKEKEKVRESCDGLEYQVEVSLTIHYK